MDNVSSEVVTNISNLLHELIKKTKCECKGKNCWCRCCDVDPSFETEVRKTTLAVIEVAKDDKNLKISPSQCIETQE